MRIIDEFTFVSASEFSRLAARPADVSAVYGIFIRGADRVLEIAQYFQHATALPLWVGEYGHVYSGCSSEVETRIRRHLAGDAAVSTFRKTLLSVEAVHGAVSRSGIGKWGGDDVEVALSRWLGANAVVGWRRSSEPRRAESQILAACPSPLNIQGRRNVPFAQYLMKLRRQTYGTWRDQRPSSHH